MSRSADTLQVLIVAGLNTFAQVAVPTGVSFDVPPLWKRDESAAEASDACGKGYAHESAAGCRCRHRPPSRPFSLTNYFD
jgi:predicted glycosyltransferase